MERRGVDVVLDGYCNNLGNKFDVGITQRSVVEDMPCPFKLRLINFVNRKIHK